MRDAYDALHWVMGFYVVGEKNEKEETPALVRKTALGREERKKFTRGRRVYFIRRRGAGYRLSVINRPKTVLLEFVHVLLSFPSAHDYIPPPLNI